uniref:Uncharacterized protein n=1 Tax=Knipowitschia caucasica TaxID=637954 RepID=A0AAV2LK67_KNICA
MALPLEAKFFAQLDKHSTALLALAREKGGKMREKLAPIMHTYDQAEDIHMKRTSILKALIIIIGEDVSNLIKEYVDCQEDDLQGDLELVTMAVFSIGSAGVRCSLLVILVLPLKESDS